MSCDAPIITPIDVEPYEVISVDSQQVTINACEQIEDFDSRVVPPYSGEDPPEDIGGGGGGGPPPEPPPPDPPPLPMKPINITPPAVSGTLVEGSVLTTTSGTWDGNYAPYRYQWMRVAADSSSQTAIQGATATTYTLVQADVGFRIRSKVRATNAQGFTNALSAISSIITAGNIIHAASASAADVQTAINSASNNDTVVVPASSVTWNSIGITCNKGITLDFTGVTITRGTGTSTLVGVTTHSTAAFRLTGGTFNHGSAASSLSLNIGGGFSNARFRIDHVTYQTTIGGSYLVRVNDAWGLFDHCTFIADDASEMLHNEAYGAISTQGWGEIITPGGGDALYIEDCTFSKYDQTDPFMWGTSAIQSYYGGRTVLRHCTFNYCQIDQHGTPNAIGTRWWEVYENHWNFPANSDGIAIVMRAGSGVIFNNTATIGSGAQQPHIALEEEDAGYPVAYQIGRGKSSNGSPPYDTNQVLDPAYCWNNFITPTSGSSNVVAGRDFYANTTKPGYTAYTYPHPLTL